MKKSIWFLLALGGSVLSRMATAQPTPLPGCCLAATPWSNPTLHMGSTVAVDISRQRVYATDINGSHTVDGVWAFHYDGTPDTGFGGGTGHVAFPFAFGVAVGPCGYEGVYAVNRGAAGSTVIKYDAYGNQAWTSPQLPNNGSRGIYVDEDGNSYVSDELNKIYVIDSTGALSTTIIGSGSVGPLNAPTGITSVGLNLYVADANNNRVVQFTETGHNTHSFNPGKAVTIAPSAQLSASQAPLGIYYGLDGNFYIAFGLNNTYGVFDGNLNPLQVCTAQPASSSAFGIALDETGAIYLTGQSVNVFSKMQACFSQPASNPCYTGSNPPVPGVPFIFPSPAKGNTATVSYNMTGSGNVDIKVWNSNGELVTEVTDRKASGVQVTPFNITGFTPGVYFFSVTLKYDSGTSETSKPKPFAVVR